MAGRQNKTYTFIKLAAHKP